MVQFLLLTFLKNLKSFHTQACAHAHAHACAHTHTHARAHAHTLTHTQQTSQQLCVLHHDQ